MSPLRRNTPLDANAKPRALPVAGGLLALLIALLWYSSALWYYNGFSVPI
jgi:hypothetical protein